MNIQEALKETEIVTPDHINDIKNLYAKLFDGILYWYDVKRDEYFLPVTLQDINNANWRTYHEVEEIRPEKAGELWKNNLNDEYYHTTVPLPLGMGGGLALFSCYGRTDRENIFHGEDWTRLSPPVEDNSVERVEIEGVVWLHKKDCQGKHVEYSGVDDPKPNNFKDIPVDVPMKMILEIPKDKP